MKKILILVALAALVAAYFFFDLGQYLTLDGIKQVVADVQGFYAENQLLVLAVFFVIYVGVTAASLPGAAIMTLAAGAHSSGLSWGQCWSPLPQPWEQRSPSCHRALSCAIRSKRVSATD